MKSSTYATGFTVRSGSAPVGIVVIGASVGGLAAFEELLPSLPQKMCPPVVIVQHRGKETRMGLCNYLQRRSHLPVREPEDKEEIEPGKVYLAPADYHLMIEERSFALSTAAPVYFARPSIDVLLKLPPTATEPAPPVLFSPATAVTARRAWCASNVAAGWQSSRNHQQPKPE